VNYSIQLQHTINAPLNDVWAILSDFNNVYTWAPAVTHSGELNDKNNQVGAGRYCTIKGFGSIEETITQWQEKNSFTYTVSDLGPLTGATSSWLLQSKSSTTTTVNIQLNYRLKFSFFGKLLHKLMMRKKLENGIKDTLNALKKRIESGKLVRPLIDKQLLASSV
jgi:uncharacterized membrane protein